MKNQFIILIQAYQLIEIYKNQLASSKLEVIEMKEANEKAIIERENYLKSQFQLEKDQLAIEKHVRYFKFLISKLLVEVLNSSYYLFIFRLVL